MDWKRRTRNCGCLIVLGLFIGIIIYNLLPTSSPDTPAYDAAAKLKAECIIYVDFSRNSGENRMYIYDILNERILYKCKVLNGKGGNHKFSNLPGSNCSSIGVYKILEQSVLSNGYKCIRLDGLSKTNSNALTRGIVIHPSKLASIVFFQFPGNFPLTNSSLGCFSVSYKDYNKLVYFIKNKNIKYLVANS